MLPRKRRAEGIGKKGGKGVNLLRTKKDNHSTRKHLRKGKTATHAKNTAARHIDGTGNNVENTLN
jgi:hypothetical protein